MHGDSTSTTEIDSFRREQGHAVLSMANGEDTYAVSVSFGYDSDAIFSICYGST